MKFDHSLADMEGLIGGSCIDDLRALVETDTGKPTSFDDGDVVFSLLDDTITARVESTQTLYKLELGTDDLDEVDWDTVEWTRV